MALKTLLMPDGLTTIRVDSINRVTAFPNGVGVFNPREQMVGWIASTDAEMKVWVVSQIDDIINHPTRAKQPDWSDLPK
jgi:hypothetical protein